MIRISVVVLALIAPLAAFAQPKVPENQAEIALSFAPIVKETTPAVVNIYARRIVPGSLSPFAGDPFFEQFFQRRAVPRVQNSLGSGVIVSPSGIVASNYHVVGRATEIRVVLSDRREYDAQVMLADEARDIAVLKLDAEGPFPALEFADSDRAEVGDLVLAIGNPFGVGQTVTSGIVSGLARSGGQGDADGAYFIQTDAAINPGNSGGALVDMTGRLLGLNTSILTRSGGSNGIGFAIPGNLVRAYVAGAEAGETELRWPWSGIAAQALDSDLAQALGLDRPEGLLISDLHPLSPFAKAGLKPGDVLTAIDGLPVGSLGELGYRLLTREGTDGAVASYMRDGAERSATVAITGPPDSPPRDRRQIPGRGALGGLVLERINPAVIDELGLPLGARGVVVREVNPRLGRAGVLPGDILVSINGAAIDSPGDAVAAAARVHNSVDLQFQRGGQRLTLRLRG